MAKSAEELLIYLFDEILPKHGMNLRVKQKELSLEMLRALQENKLALCEAEVGTGKTHASMLSIFMMEKTHGRMKREWNGTKQ